MTEDLLVEVRRLYADGKTTTEIAAQVGQSRSWVITQLVQAGVRSKAGGARRIEVDEAWVIEQYVNERRSMAAIAAELDVGLAVVKRVLRTNQVPVRDRAASNSRLGREELARLYVDEHLTIGEIAERLGRSSSGVGAALHRHNIPIRRKGAALTIPREELQQHLNDGLTNTQIAVLHDVTVNAVRLRLRSEHLRRPRPTPPPPSDTTPPEHVLSDLYVDQQLSLDDIAVQFAVPHATVRRWLDRTGIERRPRTYTTNTEPGHDLDHQMIRNLYVEEQWTSVEIGRHIGVTKRIVLDHLHRHGVPLRPPGAKRPGTDRALLDRLYADPDIIQILQDANLPTVATLGPLRRRFPNPAPLSDDLVSSLYTTVGLSISQIPLVTGHFDLGVRRALQQAGIGARDGSERAPWTLRSANGTMKVATTRRMT